GHCRRSRAKSPPNSTISGPLIVETPSTQQLSLPLYDWWVPGLKTTKRGGPRIQRKVAGERRSGGAG
ncbi:hypothetical protein LINPERHAP1_LOCUS35652, partial [Linum perenne]